MQRIYPFLTYDDAPAAIRQLVTAFGFTENLVVPGANPEHVVVHAQLSWRGELIMLSSADRGDGSTAPSSRPGASAVHLVVDDPDEHCRTARENGADIVEPPAVTPHGSRGYTARDREGNVWRFDTYAPAAPS